MSLKWVCEPSSLGITMHGLIKEINFQVLDARRALLRESQANGSITIEEYLEEMNREINL
jgi:hypothetical protein